MSFVGKILVVIQLMLSVVFLGFAGAVYQTQTNWRTESRKVSDQLTKARTEHSELQAQFDSFKTEATKAQNSLKDDAGKEKAINIGLKTQVDQLLREKKDLTTQSSEALRLSEISGEEARFRFDEARILRGIIERQITALDDAMKQRTALEDQIASLQVDLATALEKNKGLLALNGQLRRTLDLNRIAFDPKLVEGSVETPPSLDGLITETRPARSAGSSALVQISIGSDHGLREGHSLVVYRSGAKTGEKPKYMGNVRVVKAYPDQATAVVTERGPHGAIQKGDNVTTRLGN
jgi:hypothetical protein